MAKKRKRWPFKLSNPPVNWMEMLGTLQEFERLPPRFWMARTPAERWAAAERMRQIKHGYKPGELKMVPIISVIERRPDGTERVTERSLRLKDGTVLRWKNPTEPAADLIRKYYPEQARFL